MRLPMKMLVAAALLAPALGFATDAPARPEWPIIRRDGVKLYEGAKEFRFFGLAAPNLQQHESQLRPDGSNRFPDEFETRDLLDSLHRLGARATRSFSLSIASPQDPFPTYITARRTYNEDAFRALDRFLALCRENDVRVIIPIIASQSFPTIRGVDEFAALAGRKEVGAFWTDPAVKEDFKHLLGFLTSRRNTVSGILYRDDPAILAWQLGNEFDSYAPDRKLPSDHWRPIITAWVLEMSAHLKQLDPNHLILEAGGDRAAMIASPHIDALSGHYYEYWNRLGGRETDLTTVLRADLREIAGRKPLVVDEFGLATLENNRALMTAIRESTVVGGLLWSLRVHRRDGGFYYHNEGGTPINSYHYPGFPAGDSYDETALLRLMEQECAAINGFTRPARPPAPVPVLFRTATGLTWRGSTGASGYDLEVAESSNGPWRRVSDHLPDSLPMDVAAYETRREWEPLTLWTAPAELRGKALHFRVRGRNATGATEFSAPLAATLP